jgi:hypothetical protein
LLITSKKLCDALIFLSAAVIFISFIIYIRALFFPVQLKVFTTDFRRNKLFREMYEFIRYNFLPNMIIPSIAIIISAIPIRILMSRNIKIQINAHQKKQHRNSLRYRREGFKLENKQDFLHQVYKGF